MICVQLSFFTFSQSDRLTTRSNVLPPPHLTQYFVHCLAERPHIARRLWVCAGIDQRMCSLIRTSLEKYSCEHLANRSPDEFRKSQEMLYIQHKWRQLMWVKIRHLGQRVMITALTPKYLVGFSLRDSIAVVGWLHKVLQTRIRFLSHRTEIVL